MESHPVKREGAGDLWGEGEVAAGSELFASEGGDGCEHR